MPSRSEYGYLRISAETAYPASAAGSRVRVATFGPFLREHGIDLRYRPWLTEAEYAVIRSSAAPARKAAILARSSARLLSNSGAEPGIRLVHRFRSLLPIPGADPPRHVDAYDFDDALFLPTDRTIDGKRINDRFGALKREAQRCNAYIKRARLVIAGNPYLAGAASQHARRVEIVPTCVDVEVQPLRRHADVEVPTVGWIGSRTTSPYLHQILPVFRRLNRDRLRARLVLVGGDPSLQADWIEHRPWSLDSERADLASFDLGIMPLVDDAWARGKCGYKLLQYFSAGVPAIASPVGVNVDLVGEDRGLLASSEKQWSTALETLLTDHEARREAGTAARIFAERRYSYQVWAEPLADLLWSLA